MLRAEAIQKIAQGRTPAELIQNIQGLDYVSGNYIMDALTKAFGPYWSVVYSKPEIHKYEPVQTKMGEYTPQYVMIVKATLTVPLYDEETKTTIMVTREGYGSSTNKKKFEEQLVKTAATNALKKAAYSFGIACDLARNEQEQSYYENVFVDGWNKAATLRCAQDSKELHNLINTHQINQASLEMLVSKFTNGKDTHITPDNIGPFVKWLAGVFEKAQNKQKKAEPTQSATDKKTTPTA